MPMESDSPLFTTMYRRRTRRFPQGGKLPSKRAGLNYESMETAVPLNDAELAQLCFAASGITGVTVEEIRHLLGHLTVIGRTVASPCASLTLHLFFTNDDGVYYYKSDNTAELIPSRRVRFDATDYGHVTTEVLADYYKNTVKLSEGRLTIPREAIGSAFESMVNVPGTTLLIPIADTTREYINLLFTGLAQFKWRLWDEVTNAPAGVRKWIDNGFLDGPIMTIAEYDNILPWLCNIEAGMAMQNVSLAATAMGLGSFLMHTIDLNTVMRTLNMRFADKRRGDDIPQAGPNPVGIDGILEGYCPPYKTIEESVADIADMKWGVDGIYGARGYNLPKAGVYDQIVEIARSYLEYVYSRYGRLPKYRDAMFIPILGQVHHLDLGYYEKYFPEYLGDEERSHMQVWHSSRGSRIRA